MRINSIANSRKALVATFLGALVLSCSWTSSSFAEPWSFAFFADCRSEYPGYRAALHQLKSNEPTDSKFPSPSFVAAVGDLDPLPVSFGMYEEIIGNSVPFVPVRGNHESPSDVDFMMNKVLPLLKFPLEFFDQSSATYYFDFKNVRFIAIDRYTAYGKDLNDPEFLGWVEKAISSAGKADHVFIALHNYSPPVEPSAEPFWTMLFKHTDRVRAVIGGHTHSYSRRSISGAGYGNIYYINAGNAGRMSHGDDNLSFVGVSVDGKNLQFRAIQKPESGGKFAVTDQWAAEKPEN